MAKAISGDTSCPCSQDGDCPGLVGFPFHSRGTKLSVHSPHTTRIVESQVLALRVVAVYLMGRHSPCLQEATDSGTGTDPREL